MDIRLKKLNQLLDRHFRHFTENFTDEDTGEEVSVDRRELINNILSDEERQLIEDIAADVKNLSDADLQVFESALSFWVRYRTFDEVGLEYIRRGDEKGAIFIDNVTTLQELCEKGNRYAAYALYEKYRWGNEEQSIFINRQKAKEYYDLAGEIPYKEKWDDSDDPGEEIPSNYEYVLTGNTTSLDAVETLIRDLCKRFGIPENEEDGLGLYVPQRALMKVLVGSDTEYYRGNILYLNREAPDRLVITSEADRGEPLLYALRQAYTNLDVEIKETEW